MLILLLISILPTIIIAKLIYKSDWKEKEPLSELFKAFFLGIFAALLTIIISYLVNIIDVTLEDANYFKLFIYIFIGIALIEEFSKWIIGFFFLKNNKNYDYTFDGIVYFSYIALGFATFENILYTLSGGILIAIIRAIATVPGHAFFGIFSGYYYSLHRKELEIGNNKLSNKYLFYSLFIPVIYHGIFDFCLFTQNIIFLIIFLIFLIYLYVKSYKLIKRAMLEERPIKNTKEEDIKYERKKICSWCGKEVNGRFCVHCGNKIEE